jgi:cysteine-rich repeat protein
LEGEFVFVPRGVPLELFSTLCPLVIPGTDICDVCGSPTCIIDFEAVVIQNPTFDSSGDSGYQTSNLGRAEMEHNITSDPGAGQGSNTVTVEFCGDGVVDGTAGETCDPPTFLCNITRTACLIDADCDETLTGVPGQFCGVEVAPVLGGEADRECRNTGTPLECTYCGDGVEDPGEDCDDGNDIDDDGCTNECEITVCGDGVVGNSGYCRDATTGAPRLPSFCLSNSDCLPDEECRIETCEPVGPNADPNCDPVLCIKCGDTIIDPGETCDTNPGIPVNDPAPGDLRDCRPEGSPNECTYCGDALPNELPPQTCDRGGSL